MTHDADIKTVILCGGRGMRLLEETERTPKALVKIGPMAVIWHIMKHYAHYGFRDFVLCLGYRGEQIREYFLNLQPMTSNFTLKIGPQGGEITYFETPTEEWNISFIDTGQDTPTGGRVKRIADFVGDEFFLTYCDGLADVDLSALLRHHRAMGKSAMLTAVHPPSRFGVVEVEDGLAKSFKEKPALAGMINGGFFVFTRKVFDLLDDDTVLEEEPLRTLAKAGELAVHPHTGYWQCMDTFKEVEMFNAMWQRDERPWVVGE